MYLSKSLESVEVCNRKFYVENFNFKLEILSWSWKIPVCQLQWEFFELSWELSKSYLNFPTWEETFGPKIFQRGRRLWEVEAFNLKVAKIRTDWGLWALTCRFDYYLLSDEDLGKDCSRDCEEDFRECVILCGGISSCISNCNRNDVTCKDSKLHTRGTFDQ